jgi:hypothetical protein
MALTANMKQMDTQDCLIVCQTPGELDIPARLIEPVGFNVMFPYKAHGWLAFQTVAFDNGPVSRAATTALNKADERRFWDYKFATCPNRA